MLKVLENLSDDKSEINEKSTKNSTKVEKMEDEKKK